MISINNVRNGNVIKLNGELFTVIYFQHVKPGKGGAFVRTKLKNFKTGAGTEKTFRAGESVEDVRVEEKKFSIFIIQETITISWILRHTNKCQ